MIRLAHPRRPHIGCASILGLLLLSGCGWRAETSEGTTPSAPESAPVVRVDDPRGLHNVLQVGDAVLLGSEPHGDEAFASLQRLGVKTVVSVDGARPDLALAAKHGLRYVHIPIGYDGIDEQAALALARVAADSQRPIYVHCHHGKHRGPAAAAVLCAAAGLLDATTSHELLVQAGTGKQYAGLWRDVQQFVPPSAEKKLPELVEVADVGSLAAAMAELDRHADNLELLAAVDWSVPDDHPDLVAVQEALILREALHEATRHLADDAYDETFREQLAASERMALELEAALQSGLTDAARQHLQRLRQACNTCHEQFRN